MRADTAVIIVNYHSWEMLCRCVQSLKDHLGRPVYIIVVDNSEESECDEIRARYSDLELIRVKENRGFAAGCNAGLRRALECEVDYILLLNPDTWLESDFLHSLLTVFAHDSRIGAAGPKILSPHLPGGIWNGGGQLNWFAGGTRKIVTEQSDGVSEVSFLSGCALLLRAEAVREAGFMAEEYFLYFEDTDYLQRLSRAGYKTVYVPRAEVLHEGSKTVGFQSSRYVYYFSRNRIWFMRRWARWYQLLIFMLYDTFVKLPGAVIVFGLRQKKPALAWAYFKGFLHGISGRMGRLGF
ncbi:glycosyltransferase family 2 protein [Desulfobacterota bacterium M19]